MNICYVVGAGSFDGRGFYPQAGDYVIAADGGYAHLCAMSQSCDEVVGDFDSLDKQPNHPNVTAVSADKDDTDTLLCIRRGLELGFKRFILLGGTGGRLDHTLANIQSLAFLRQNGASGILYGDGQATCLTGAEGVTVTGMACDYISVLAYSNHASGVCISGALYELEDDLLTTAFPLGVSNRFCTQPVEISAQQGTLFVIWQADGLHLRKVLDR